MPRVKIQLADNIKRVVTLDTDATKGATLGTNVFLPNGQVGTPTSVLQWLGGAVASSGGSSGGGGVPIQNILTTKGDLLTRDSQVQRMAIGDEDDVLRVSASGLPEWRAGAELSNVDDTNVTLTLSGGAATSLLAATTLTLGWSGVLAATRGGTGFGEYEVGDILYADSTTTLERLPVGVDGEVLTLYGGVPIWAPAAGGGVNSVVGTINQIDVDDSDPDNPVVSLAAPVLASLTLANSAVQPGDLALDDLNDVNLAGLTDGDFIAWDASTNEWVVTPGSGVELNTAPETRGASFSGGSSAIIVPTNKVPISIREDCRIAGYVVLTQGGTGSCVLNIYSSSYGGFPPSASICASNKPTISSGVKTQDTTLTGWTTALGAGDTLLVELESSSTFTSVSIFLVLVPISYSPPSGFDIQDARDAVGGILTDTDTITWAYDGSTIEAEVVLGSTGSVESGQYTPTGTAVSNCSGVTPSVANYMRVGDVVTVSGYVTFTTTAGGATLTQVGLSLPIASNLGASYDCAGVGASAGTTNNNNETSIQGDASNNRAELQFYSSATGSVTKWYTYTYKVI